MTDPNRAPQFRYRIRFGKQGVLRYTSHLDVARLWERVFRRAKFPVIYSQGFNPRPKLQLAAALPLGYASQAEVVDVWLDEALGDLQVALLGLKAVSPVGLEVYSIELEDPRSPALQAICESAVYKARIVNGVSYRNLQASVDSLLACEQVWRERRDRKYDLRPLILDLFAHSGPPVHLTMKLAMSQSGGSGRADEVIDSLGLDVSAVQIERTGLNFLSETAENMDV